MEREFAGCTLVRFLRCRRNNNQVVWFQSTLVGARSGNKNPTVFLADRQIARYSGDESLPMQLSAGPADSRSKVVGHSERS